MTASEILDIVIDNRNKFVVASFFGYFKRVDDRMVVTEIDYCMIEFGCVDETQLNVDIKETEDWSEFIKDKVEGFYSVDAGFSIQRDGDDFRDWSWCELEHAIADFAYTKEDANKLFPIDIDDIFLPDDDLPF